MSSKDQRSRLHPLSLPFRFLSHLRGFLFPIFLVVAFSKDLDWEAWTILILIPIMIFETWAYMTLRFWITEGELIVTEGVIFREERHIPLDRIQTVDSTQNLAQRLLGVVEVTVETAGSSKPEAHLKVLSIEARDGLRASIFEGAKTSAIDLAEPEVGTVTGSDEVMHVKPMELALLGLNLWRGVAIIAIGLGLAAQLSLFDNGRLGWLAKQIRELTSQVTAGGIWAEILAEVIIAIGLIGFVFALSVGSVWIKLFGFRLTRNGDEFRTECGLFTRHATTVPKGRVQALSIQAPLSLRIFGRSLVKVRTAGGSSEDDKASATRQWLTPVIANAEVQALIGEFIEDFDQADIEWQPLASGAKRRLIRKACLLTLVFWAFPIYWLSGAAAFVLPIYCPAVAALFFGVAYFNAKRLGWAVTKSAFMMRDGVLNQRTLVLPRNRIQSIGLHASPFDRRWNMTSISVDTAGADIGHSARLPFLNLTVARNLAFLLTPRSSPCSFKTQTQN